jgi:hypothetical protein
MTESSCDATANRAIQGWTHVTEVPHAGWAGNHELAECDSELAVPEQPEKVEQQRVFVPVVPAYCEKGGRIAFGDVARRVDVDWGHQPKGEEDDDDSKHKDRHQDDVEDVSHKIASSLGNIMLVPWALQ